MLNTRNKLHWQTDTSQSNWALLALYDSVDRYVNFVPTFCVHVHACVCVLVVCACVCMLAGGYITCCLTYLYNTAFYTHTAMHTHNYTKQYRPIQHCTYIIQATVIIIQLTTHCTHAAKVSVGESDSSKLSVNMDGSTTIINIEHLSLPWKLLHAWFHHSSWCMETHT